jgi:hypothetical protein
LPGPRPGGGGQRVAPGATHVRVWRSGSGSANAAPALFLIRLNWGNSVHTDGLRSPRVVALYATLRASAG